MLRIDIHNEKGGVGCTTIANHLIQGAQEIGLRVAAMSLDPTKSLAHELEGTGTPIVEPGAELGDDLDLLIIDRNTQHRDRVDADVRVIPIRDRRSWELACDLSDRYPAPILWVPSMTDQVPVVPSYLEGIVRLTSSIPLSHAIAQAAWRRRIVWADEDLAGSAGARAMCCAVFDLLRRAMGPEVIVDLPSTALPIAPGGSVLLRHAPRPGLRIGAVRPEIQFGGEANDPTGAELQLLHLHCGVPQPIGASWNFDDRPPDFRTAHGHAHAIDVGEGLLVQVTNTGRRTITAARLVVTDDQSLGIPLRAAPRVAPPTAA